MGGPLSPLRAGQRRPAATASRYDDQGQSGHRMASPSRAGAGRAHHRFPRPVIRRALDLEVLADLRRRHGSTVTKSARGLGVAPSRKASSVTDEAARPCGVVYSGSLTGPSDEVG